MITGTGNPVLVLYHIAVLRIYPRVALQDRGIAINIGELLLSRFFAQVGTRTVEILRLVIPDTHTFFTMREPDLS